MSRKKKRNYFVRSAQKEISLLRKHVGIEGTGDDVRISGEIRPSNIQDFYREYFAFVRPKNLSDRKILPNPDNNKLRALYVGQPDANVFLNLAVRHALYVDQLVLVDPFIILPHERMLEDPRPWMEVFMNRALCLCALEEWINSELVLVVPSVFYYRPELKEFIISNPSTFVPRYTPEQKRVMEHQLLSRLLVSEPPDSRESLLDVIATKGKEFAPGERDELLEQTAEYEAKYPIRFRLDSDFFAKHFEDHSRPTQIVDMSLGIPLLAAPLIAEEIGAFLVFEHKLSHDLVTAHEESPNSRTVSLQELAIAFQNLEFPFLHNVPADKALELRKKGYLHSFRVYLRDLWSAAGRFDAEPTFDERSREFSDRLKAEYEILEREWRDIRRELQVKAATSGLIAGLSASAPIVLGNIDWTLAGLFGFGGTLLHELRDGYFSASGKVNEVHNQPLAVFLVLEN